MVLAGSRLVAAAVAFAAVALTVLALALLWEGIRGLLRRRTIGRRLERFAQSSRGIERDSGSGGGLLREERLLPGWLAPLAGRVPGVTDIQLMLEQAHSSWSAGSVLLLTVGLALGFALVCAFFGFGVAGSLAGMAVGAVLPYLFLRRRRGRRRRAFEATFADAIDLLARSARAGHAFQSGLQEVSEESPEPVSEEFRQVFEEQKFGLPLSESLQGLVDRIDLVDVRMFVTSVLIQKETGGNLAENLDNLGRIIRERFRFQRQIKVHTAHGRMTGRVLAAAPVAAAAGLYLVAPEYMKPLLTQPIGRWMIVAALVLQFLGFLVIRRMTDLDY